MDEDSACCLEARPKLDVLEHIAGRLKPAIDHYFSK
jgi:hypothetical protein